ncbi:MAG: hypothetical protein E7033_04435 [Akkermansiaceae bacterium]|nr:hypothetical protein [Akkermansiaceae bacterium]
MNNKFLSDYLPPAMVRDLRRSLHTRSYCITLGLAFLAALWVQFHAVSDAAGYDHFSTGVKLAFIAVTLFWFIIPNRAGAAVSADAGVRGTNFLTLTPLSSRSIILQMWLSAAAQIVVTAAVGSLFLVWRHALPMEAQHSTISLLNTTPSTPAQDWVVYGIIVLCGLVMCAVSLFLAPLNRIFRIAGLIFVLSLLWGWVQENLALLLHPNPQGYLLGRMAAEDWVALAAMALLSIAALLELARRCYAAPAENCSRALRLLVLLPLLCSVAMYITQLPHANRIAVENTLTFSVYFALAVCMSDALLPAPTHRNRAEPLLPWVPRYLQQNGSGPAALFLALVLLAATGVQCLTEPAGHSETHIVRLFTETAAVVYYLLAGLLLTDMLCKRSNPNRPVYGGLLLVAIVLLSNMLLVGLNCTHHDTAALLLPGCGFFAPHTGWHALLLAGIPMLATLGTILYRDKQ